MGRKNGNTKKCVPPTVHGTRERVREWWAETRPQTNRSSPPGFGAPSVQKDPKEGYRVGTPGSLTHCWKEATSGVKCSGHSDSAPAALGNCVFRKGSEE